MRNDTYSSEAKRLQAFISGVGRDAAVAVGAVDSEALNAHLAQNAVTGHGSVGAHDHQTVGAGGDLLQYFRTDGTRDMAGNIIPAAVDTYDLGSETRMWRKIWASELDTVIFAQNTMTLLGSMFRVGKGLGTFAADVAAADTTIDFGQTMTVGHFVELRGALKVEYLQIGALVSGTIYNVTRNLDGSGSNDWPAGTPFSILGTTNDGRVEINAATTPRIRVVRQGATYNAQTEVVRIGDMNGAFGAAAERYGFGVGDYAGGNYFSYNGATAGQFRIKAGGGNVTIDEQGISSAFDTSYASQRSFAFRLPDGTLRAALSSWNAVDGNTILLRNYPGATENADISIESYSTGVPAALAIARTTLRASYGGSSVSLGVAYQGSALGALYGFCSGDFLVQGDFVRALGLNKVPGYIAAKRDTPLTHANWSPAVFSTSAKSGWDAKTFGVPAGAKAIYVNVAVQDSGAAANDCWIAFSPTNTAAHSLMCRCFPANDRWVNYSGVKIPLGNNETFYRQTQASGTNTLDVYLEIWGFDF